MMSVRATNVNPPFRFLRASHASFTSRDLAKSRAFYTEVLGLVVSDEDEDTLYLRGLEERAHHSLTIKRSKVAVFYTSLGFRIADYMTMGERPVGVFLHVKNTPYDLVFLERQGPACHHYRYIVPDIQSMLRACDTLGELGWGDYVEFGPGKHRHGRRRRRTDTRAVHR